MTNNTTDTWEEEIDTWAWVPDDRIGDIKQFLKETLSTREKSLAKWIDGNVGASSKTLYCHMATGNAATMSFFPSPPCDEGDRARCIVLLNCIPEWWDRLDEMEKYPYWKEQIPLIREEARLLQPVEDPCNCAEMSCRKGCSRNHTHKGFSCPKCHKKEHE